MKKATLSAVLAAAMLLSLTACGTEDVTNLLGKDEEQVTTVEETATEAATEAETEEETEAATEEETEVETEAETEAETEEETEEAAASAPDVTYDEFVRAEGLSENYVDMEKRSFSLNGKVYTLGETTYQQMIDDGVAFDEDDLNNASNNVNKNYSTSYITVRINDLNSVQFEFINTTDSNIKESECVLCYVRWYTLYVPMSTYDDSRNEEIVASLNDAAKHLSFSFPLYLTKDELLEKNKEGAEEDDYNNVEYRVESEVYYGYSGYDFEFNSDTNQLEEVSIDWLP